MQQSGTKQGHRLSYIKYCCTGCLGVLQMYICVYIHICCACQLQITAKGQQLLPCHNRPDSRLSHWHKETDVESTSKKCRRKLTHDRSPLGSNSCLSPTRTNET